MSQISTIVVATDFSARAGRAVRRAARIAHERKAALHLLFVVERGPFESLQHMIAPGSDKPEDMLLTSIDARMRELAEVLHSHYNVHAESRVVVGTVHAEIIAQVANEGADLLVIGAHGEHYVGDMIFGSTASKLIRTATAPVLIVRNEEIDKYVQAMVAVDFSPRTSRAMRLARDLAPEATIHALNAVEIPFEEQLLDAGVSEDVIQNYRSRVLLDARQQMAEFLARLADIGTAHSLVAYGHVPAVISKQRDLLDADLVVVGRHGEAGEAWVLLGSVTKHILYEAECDVLVVP